MKAISGYPVLDNRPIDQWKVAELKEELKRRNLITRGLKDELVRRLDEDIRREMEAEKQDADGNGVEEAVPYDIVEAVKTKETTGFETGGLGLGLGLGNSEDVEGNMGDADDGIVRLDDDVSGQAEINESMEQPVEEKSIEEQQLGLGSCQVLEGTLAMNYVPSNDLEIDISENLSSPKAVDGKGLCEGKLGMDNEGSRAQEQSEYVKPLHEDGKLDSFDSNNQVSEVSSSLGFLVKSNSISTDYVSFNEKNELKDNLIDDNVKLESVVKPEMVQPSSSDLVPDVGESHPSDVEKPHGNKVSVQDTDNNVTIADVSQNNYSADLGSEKLNLDRSSGDDSMEEDALESKHIDSSEEVVEKTDKNEVTTFKEEIPVATMAIDVPAKETGNHHEHSILANASTDKRKLSDHEAVLNNEPTKRQRRWKSESNSFKEPQISKIPPLFAVKDVPQPVILQRNLSGSKSAGGVDEPPKEQEVPASLKPATNSLRIDRFLRPFTLKAVQELLAKTGTVTSFWMDQIKTHCYVTYSSVEEAVETRNAVYNLQWPPNGGRYLMAEFVDPKEVKARLEPPPSPPAASEPPAMPQPSPRRQSVKQRITQQPTLPPPPPLPLPNPPQARERAFPPLPPQDEKVEAPILTLDDLFRKTKATPRIYYLPLSQEQVSAVVEARRTNPTKQ